MCEESAWWNIYMHVVGMDPNTGVMHGAPQVQVVFVIHRNAFCDCNDPEFGGPKPCKFHRPETPCRDTGVNLQFCAGNFKNRHPAIGTCTHYNDNWTSDPDQDIEVEACTAELPEKIERYRKTYPVGDFPCRPNPQTGNVECESGDFPYPCKKAAKKCAQNYGQGTSGDLWRCLHDEVRKAEEEAASSGEKPGCTLEDVYSMMMDTIDRDMLKDEICGYIKRTPYKIEDCRGIFVPPYPGGTNYQSESAAAAEALGWIAVDLDSIDVDARDMVVRNKNKDLASLFLNIELFGAKTKATLDRETSYAHVNQANIYCNHERYPTDSWYLTINYSNKCMPFLDAPHPFYQKETRSWGDEHSGGDDYWIARRSVQPLDAYDENLINPQVAGEIKTWQNINAAAPNYYAGLNRASIDKLISLVDQMPCPCSPVNQG
jgi:hypothetical protein